MSGADARDRILVTGKDGQVGWELLRTLSTLAPVVAVGRSELDLSQPGLIREVVRSVRPAVIVNAAGYTAVDRAEEETQAATAINGEAPGILAEEARTLGALLIHYSTDYVFDGTKKTPYTEDDPTCPESVYGESKRQGEEAIAAIGGAHLIFRTSWVYGMRGNNFLRTMVNFFRMGRQLRVIDDQVGTPTWSRLLAEATGQVLAGRFFGVSDRLSSVSEVAGLYHVGATGETSWHGFAQAIIDRVVRLSGDAELAAQDNTQVVAIPSIEFPQAAKRPARSVLAKERFQETFGCQLPQWEEQLELCMAGGDVQVVPTPKVPPT